MFEEGSFRCVNHLVLCNRFRKFLKFSSLFVHHLFLFIKSKEIYMILYTLNLYLPGGDREGSGEKQWSHIRALFTHHAGTDYQWLDRICKFYLHPDDHPHQYWWCTTRPRRSPCAPCLALWGRSLTCSVSGGNINESWSFPKILSSLSFF